MLQARFKAAAAALASCCFLSSCGLLPVDATGTHSTAAHGTLRVGVTPHSPFTDVDDEGRVTGSEVDLIRGFAEQMDARVEFEVGSERQLVDLMREDNIDVAIGGFTSDSPWSSDMALTRPYDKRADGQDVVMAVRPGENRMLVELESYLAREQGELR